MLSGAWTAVLLILIGDRRLEIAYTLRTEIVRSSFGYDSDREGALPPPPPSTCSFQPAEGNLDSGG